MITEKKKLNRFLSEIKHRIQESFGEKVSKIILFGSYARGDYDGESDVDILVIVDDENLANYDKQKCRLIKHYLDTEDIILSIIIEKASMVNRYAGYSPFLINVSNEGVVLHG